MGLTQLPCRFSLQKTSDWRIAMNSLEIPITPQHFVSDVLSYSLFKLRHTILWYLGGGIPLVDSFFFLLQLLFQILNSFYIIKNLLVDFSLATDFPPSDTLLCTDLRYSTLSSWVSCCCLSFSTCLCLSLQLSSFFMLSILSLRLFKIALTSVSLINYSTSVFSKKSRS